MVSITLSVPEDVRKLMKKFPEVNWSGLVRQCITEKAERLAWKQEMLKQLGKEKEFDDWAVELGRKAKKGRLKRLKDGED
ncbi:MAG TPA: hypothetical protein ENG87_01010 [Candidatus Pacearchaeota archaeon]|nr:hypothetical protein BMS3Abin17_00273 [archaeon BMS3Abin17]HDK41930.1 hypothetical protein [Candidatus Pacearchaeota archaeon]HDZ60354.1 hypothetical protein [Candidatus Pacearchaeota archaeon]